MLTKITLGDTRDAKRDAKDQEQMHKTLERAFVGNDTRCLWKYNEGTITIRHQKPLSLDALPHKYVASSRELKEANIVKGKWLPFRLRACATKAAITPGKKGRGKTTALTDPVDIQNWLFKKGDRLGVLFHDIAITRPRHHLPRSRRFITIKTVEYSGVLEVLDPEKFSNALNQGVGRGKAFGLGMITIE